MRFMRSFVITSIIAALIIVTCTNSTLCQEKYPTTIAEKDVPQYLQDISVTIRAGQAQGSGVFKVTKDGQVWVWTCGHLVEHLRTTRKLDSGKSVVEFNDAKVIKVLTENGRKVGELNFDAEVIRYSDATHGEDLALLRLRTTKFKPPGSTVFYLEKNIPALGQRLFHCGSLLGQVGSNSITNGIVSQHGRVLFNNTIFDQTNCASFPGSSGGVICLEKDGRYVGMLVRGAGESFSLFVPIRRMHTWAKAVEVDFTIDDGIKIPTEVELRKRPIDDFSATAGNPGNDDNNPHGTFSYRIYRDNHFLSLYARVKP